MEFESVIGLEVHVQLATGRKLFCGDAVEFDAPPNSRVCPACLGLPGALPVLNQQAVDLGVRAALGLSCTVHPISVFVRKNYFYPDLPKGYQITQLDRPLATDGVLDSPGAHVRIRRMHLEEDSGRLLHHRFAGSTAVDLNRAGVPLIEIVTEPDLRSGSDARAWLSSLKRMLQYLEVSDCDMEEGSLRVDANVSVRPAGSSGLGTRTEVKNMNSFGAVERAIESEARRQIDRVRSGDDVVRETLTWDADRRRPRVIRAKETVRDYRYFDEPDLPALELTAGRIASIGETLPESPVARARRFREDLGLSEYDAGVLTASRRLADYFEEVVRQRADAKGAANWIMTEVLQWLNRNEGGIGDFPLSAARLGELVSLVEEEKISHALARRVFERMLEHDASPAEIIEMEGLSQVRSEGRLHAWAEEVLRENPGAADRVRKGDPKVLNFLMGKLMEKSDGRADPERAMSLLRAKLTD